MTDSSNPPVRLLPAKANLEQLKKQAKELLRSVRARNTAALALASHFDASFDAGSISKNCC